MRRVAALALSAVLVTACVNPFDRPPEATARQKLEDHEAVTDQPAVIVPRRLPDGYGMLWGNMYFPRGRPDDLPGVEVCVLAESEEILGRCVGTADDSPWISFEVEGYVVVVATVSSPERRALLQPWLELEWTTDWRSVEWVDEPFA